MILESCLQLIGTVVGRKRKQNWLVTYIFQLCFGLVDDLHQFLLFVVGVRLGDAGGNFRVIVVHRTNAFAT